MDWCGAVIGLMVSRFCFRNGNLFLRLHSLKFLCLLTVFCVSPLHKRKTGNIQCGLVITNVDLSYLV